MDLTGMSPFRNAQYTPTVPLQHGIYGQMPGVQNVYLDDIGQLCPLLRVMRIALLFAPSMNEVPQ